jgi:hypothetical protein
MSFHTFEFSARKSDRASSAEQIVCQSSMLYDHADQVLRIFHSGSGDDAYEGLTENQRRLLHALVDQKSKFWGLVQTAIVTLLPDESRYASEIYIAPSKDAMSSNAIRIARGSTLTKDEAYTALEHVHQNDNAGVYNVLHMDVPKRIPWASLSENQRVVCCQLDGGSRSKETLIYMGRYMLPEDRTSLSERRSSQK